MADRFVEVPDGRLYCCCAGDGLPLLMLHGWPLDHRAWTPQIQEFSRQFHVVAYDRRGFGRSGGDPDFGREPADIDAILDDQKLRSAILMGMSRGGRAALRYALERPARVDALIVLGTALDGFMPPASLEEDIPIARYAALTRAGDFAALRAEWLAHPLMHLPADDMETMELLARMLQDYRGQDLLLPVGGSAAAVDVAARLTEISMPVLVLLGAEETAARKAIAEKLMAGLPNAELATVPGGGHLVNLTNPDGFNAVVRDFIGRHTNR